MITFFIPFYNEEKRGNIHPFLLELSQYINNKINENNCFILINDGSSDKTKITVHNNIEHSENHVNEELFIIEQKSVITVAPKDVCAVYDKELTFEQNILNCSRREPILFNI